MASDLPIGRPVLVLSPWAPHRHRTRYIEEASMQAVVYAGPKKVSVHDVPDARIKRPNDILVRITATNTAVLTCTCMRDALTLRPDAGSATRTWARSSLPHHPAQPALADAAYGFAAMAPWAGGQNELLWVPYGDHNALRLD